MIPQRAVAWLIVGALGLPIAMCLLFALARLLEAMQDQAGADVLGRINLGLFVLWAINLVGLLIAGAINSLNNPPPGSGPVQP
ncbi:MAG TPA: hypothetical protein VMJ32_10790 [Pirellulales bacterium]|nr:hypothetical protein [Pirellulales bacterium]